MVELLLLLDEYTQLQMANRQRWIDGYVNLSRANYSHHTKRYGMTQYDLRDKPAQFTVSDNEKLPNDHDKPSKEPLGIRNRTTPQEKTPSGDNDALRQFGVLVPNELRQAQTRFRDAVEVSVDIAKIGKRIVELVDMLSPPDKLTTKESSDLSSKSDTVDTKILETKDLKTKDLETRDLETKRLETKDLTFTAKDQ